MWFLTEKYLEAVCGGLQAGGAQAEGHWKERRGGCENIKGVGGDRACLWQIPVFSSLRVERGGRVVENIKGVGDDRACLWQIPVFWSLELRGGMMCFPFV